MAHCMMPAEIILTEMYTTPLERSFRFAGILLR